MDFRVPLVGWEWEGRDRDEEKGGRGV